VLCLLFRTENEKKSFPQKTDYGLAWLVFLHNQNHDKPKLLVNN